MGRTAARRSRDPARKHQKYHQSGPARPATGGAQNGGDFVVGKRKMARTGRRALGSARRSQANSSPARCVRALRLNSMPRLHSLRREASQHVEGGRFSAPWFWRSASPAVIPVHGRSTTIPRRARPLLRGVGTPLAILKRASSPLHRQLAPRTLFPPPLSSGPASPPPSPTPALLCLLPTFSPH